MPESIANDLAAHCACVAGAAGRSDVEAMLRELGFVDVRVELEAASRDVIGEWGQGFEQYVSSAKTQGLAVALGLMFFGLTAARFERSAIATPVNAIVFPAGRLATRMVARAGVLPNSKCFA